MNIDKCKLVAREFNRKWEYQWIDENNLMIPNIVSEKQLIKDIDFSKLPSNILNNYKIYLGENYYIIPFNEWKEESTPFNTNFNLESDFGKEFIKWYNKHKKNLTLNK